MTKGRRFVVQLGLLAALYVLSLPDPKLFIIVIKVLVLITLPINATVAALLVWTSRHAPDIDTLRERADDAVTLFLISLGLAATAWLIPVLQFFGIVLPGSPALVFLSWIALLVAVPALGWMGTWRDYWMPVVRRREKAE